ncbi:MAG: Tad domain-containing protein [Candidatus Riflebacteria bacterium]|nr:Tad domain-containing protein [Candidatus Riflebacteria bacterium]
MSHKNKTNSKRANITLLTAAISVFLVGIIAMVTDVGTVYYEHARLQTATNAAWKAGFDKLSEIRKTKTTLTAEDELTIKNHMKEVLAANGFSNLSDEQLRILLTQNQTNLQINANQETQLFFMKIFDIKTAKVAANRDGGSDSYSIMPIAIPHGEVHDLSVKTYDYIPFEGNQGFATDTEYILKLGGDENADPLGKSQYMIYIPTGLDGRKQATDAKTMLAYGAVFWALQIDETDKEAMVPAYWLLNNRGGGFLLRDGAKFRQKLQDQYGLYENNGYYLLDAENIAKLLEYVDVRIDKTQINDYLSGLTKGVYTNELIVPLEKRPQIAIYSSQADLDPVEKILVAAKIPYGTYALPYSSSNTNGWRRTDNSYDQNRNTKLVDLQILNDELDKYDWIHLHHEDFTGLTKNSESEYCGGKFPTDCSNPVYETVYNYNNCCYKKYPNGFSQKIYKYQYGNGKTWIKQERINNSNYPQYSSWWQKNVDNSLMDYKNGLGLCAECSKDDKLYIGYAVDYEGYYNAGKVNGMRVKVIASWKQSESVLNNSCTRKTSTKRIKSRCGTCGNCDQIPSHQANFKGCKYYNYLNKYKFNNKPLIDDELVPYVFTDADINLSPEALMAKWFTNATAYQKMKWAVAEKIKEHILKGGFMYTQCFAAETLELSLQQGAYYKTKNLTDSYKNCLAFENFTYMHLPYKRNYSSIDCWGVSGLITIQNAFTYSAFCQVSNKPNVNTGATSAFKDEYIKNYTDNPIEKMAISNQANIWKYLGGKVKNAAGEWKGHFSLLGGHNELNNSVDTKRLVLNNILYGSTSDKETSVGTHYVGRTKYQFGCVDLDNDGERSGDDYTKYMLYGFDSPVNFADIVSSDSGLYTTETKKNMNIITGDKLATYTPNTIVVVPIVGVPDTVQSYQKEVANNASANSDQEIETGDYTIYDLKVGGQNFGAAGYDDLDSKYSPSDVYMEGLKNSVQVIGFAKFQLKAEKDYNRSDVLGEPLDGQIRGDFIGYVVDPRETEALLQQYNLGY